MLPSTMDNPPGGWPISNPVPQISDEDSGASADDEASISVSLVEEVIKRKPVAKDEGRKIDTGKAIIRKEVKQGHQSLPAEILEV